MERKINKVCIVLFVLLGLTSCAEFLPGITGNMGGNAMSVDSGYLDIPEGWRVAYDSNYLSLGRNPEFNISSSGDSLSFVDSDGNTIILEKNKHATIISPDNMDIDFQEGKIVLTLNGVDFVFERK